MSSVEPGIVSGIVGRFAPSTTGHAHPGTLLAGLLAWLDARSRGGRVILRLEDLDPERCRPELADSLVADLAWLGLDWDETVRQSTQHRAHMAALNSLAASDLLYPCRCSRAELRRSGRRAPDGGFAYDNRCRQRPLPADGWRASTEPLRARLPDRAVTLRDESGDDLSQSPSHAFGDPVVRRRDGAVAYNLAVVVDDAASGVSRVVRGRDIAPSTATQVLLQQLLSLPTPTYRHHLLLLEPRGDKLAKLHGSVDSRALRPHYSPEAMLGFLAAACGLRQDETPCTASRLLDEFSWERVRRADRVIDWNGKRLSARP